MTAGQRVLLAALPAVGSEITWRDAFGLDLSSTGVANAVAALMKRGIVICDLHSIMRVD